MKRVQFIKTLFFISILTLCVFFFPSKASAITGALNSNNDLPIISISLNQNDINTIKSKIGCSNPDRMFLGITMGSQEDIIPLENADPDWTNGYENLIIYDGVFEQGSSETDSPYDFPFLPGSYSFYFNEFNPTWYEFSYPIGESENVYQLFVSPYNSNDECSDAQPYNYIFTPIFTTSQVPYTFTDNSNAAPEINTITISTNPAPVNTSFAVVGEFSDIDTADTHTAVWDWGDGNTTTGTVTESNGSGSVNATHTYTSLGSYLLSLTVTDNAGLLATQQQTIGVMPVSGLQGANLKNVNYNGVNFDGQNISGSNLQSTIFNNASLINTNFSGSNIKVASFVQADLSGALLNGANLQTVNFTGAIVTNGNFQGSNLKNANMTNANLSGATFNGANVKNIVWSNTICPNSTNSDTHGGTCVGQGGGL